MEYPIELRTDAIELSSQPAVLAGSRAAARSLTEETANAITHGFGLLLSLAGTEVLLSAAARHADRHIAIGCGIYAATLVAVYAASTFSHAIQEPRLKRTLRTIDQAAIYLLCAGSFTPFALFYACHDQWWLVLAAMWGVALAGFASKILWAHRVDAVCIITYVLLGWMPVLVTRPVLEHAPGGAILWALLGGACYTTGLWFLVRDHKRPYFHAIWHLLVIAGSACHYVVALEYIVLRGA